MNLSIDGDGTDGDRTTRWEGYSDYQTVSTSIARSVDEALEAYAELNSLHVENAKVQPRQAAHARSRIVLAALKLVPELREDAGQNEEYRKILARWLGPTTVSQDGSEDRVVPEFNGDGPDGGFISGLDEVQLNRTCPGWLEQFVIDIRTAGWELGYLKAGRTQSESTLPEDEQQARNMFTE